MKSYALKSAAACAALLLGACAHKTVMLKPQAEFLGAGTYRAKITGADGAMTGLSLQLNGNGRFTLATLKGGCFVSEQRGNWRSDEDELQLHVQKALTREECGSTWVVAERDTAFHCPLRGASTRGFMLLHEEILQGVEWTQWTRDDSQNFAIPEKGPGTEPGAKLSLNAETDAKGARD